MTTGHVRQRSPGSWEIRYTLGTDSTTGKRRIATTTDRGGKRDAEKELRRLLRTVDTGEHVDPTRTTVGQWLSTWLDTIQQEVAPRSHIRYAVIVERHLVPALGNLPITKLAPAHIQDFYNFLATDGRRDGKPGPLAPQSRRQIHRVLSTALRRAIEDQVIARNPTEVFKRRLPKVERKEMTVLTADQSTRLLDDVRQTPLYWPVLIALATGARRGEILALRWRNVDFDRGAVRIVESLDQTTRDGLSFKAPKNGRGRVITLPTFAIDELRRRKREQAEGLLRFGVRQSGATLVCARHDGQPTTPMGLSNMFFKFVRQLDPDFPRLRFHDLRHTHATQLLLARVHPRIAQERLGHSTVALTLDLYSHVTASMQEDAAAKIDAAFGGPKPSR
jgi:integrase